MRHSADPNAQDSFGNTPCHYASQYGNADVLHYILKKNPKLYLKNNEGRTPIDVASHPEIVEIFGRYV